MVAATPPPRNPADTPHETAVIKIVRKPHPVLVRTPHGVQLLVYPHMWSEAPPRCSLTSSAVIDPVPAALRHRAACTPPASTPQAIFRWRRETQQEGGVGGDVGGGGYSDDFRTPRTLASDDLVSQPWRETAISQVLLLPARLAFHKDDHERLSYSSQPNPCSTTPKPFLPWVDSLDTSPGGPTLAQ